MPAILQGRGLWYQNSGTEFGDNVHESDSDINDTLGANKHASVTLALRDMVTAMLVTRSGTWLAVPKYSGTNASQITHVVYIVKPVNKQNP